MKYDLYRPYSSSITGFGVTGRRKPLFQIGYMPGWNPWNDVTGTSIKAGDLTGQFVFATGDNSAAAMADFGYPNSITQGVTVPAGEAFNEWGRLHFKFWISRSTAGNVNKLIFKTFNSSAYLCTLSAVSGDLEAHQTYSYEIILDVPNKVGTYYWPGYIQTAAGESLESMCLMIIVGDGSVTMQFVKYNDERVSLNAINMVNVIYDSLSGPEFQYVNYYGYDLLNFFTAKMRQDAQTYTDAQVGPVSGGAFTRYISR